VAAHKYKNSWDTWGGGVGCDISSLTPPNTGASVVCGVVLLVFGEVLAFDRGADSCVLKVAVRAPSSGSMSATSREGLPRNVEFVAYGPLLWRACCGSRREGRRGRELLADFLENEWGYEGRDCRYL